MAGEEPRLERRGEVPVAPGSARAVAAALAALGIGAAAAAWAGAGPEPVLALLLLALWPASRLPTNAGLACLAAAEAAPLLLAAGGAASGLRVGPFAGAAAALLAIAAVALHHRDQLRARARQALDDRDRLATVDRLTGVATRAELVRQGQVLVALARRGGRPLAVLVLDVDRLRAINERFDMGTGDEVLRSVASRLREALRATDVVGRIGDDALAVVMPDTETAGARAAAERARSAVAEDGLFAAGSREEIRFTVSVGLAPLSGRDTDLEALLRRADAALAAAKRAGGDRSELST